MTAIDVSSNNSDLAALIAQHQPQHVVVRMYLGPGWEAPSQQISHDQVQIARDAGCSVGAYLWLYRGYDPVETARRAIALAQACGLEPPVMWIDVETYLGNPPPTAGEVLTCIHAIQAAGVTAGVYTSKHMMDTYLGSTTAFAQAGAVLWSATYDGVAALDVAPYCGWQRAHGKQYASKPIDLDVFDGSVV